MTSSSLAVGAAGTIAILEELVLKIGSKNASWFESNEYIIAQRIFYMLIFYAAGIPS